MAKVTRYIFYGVVFIAAFIASAAIVGFVVPKERVVTPHIVPDMSDQSFLVATHSFPFQDSTITISVPIDGSVYRGAQEADKDVTIYGNISKDTWLADTYKAMVNDPALSPLYDNLTIEFRKIRAEKNLNDDEYAELMAVYVQSLRYETFPDNPTKFPVETVMDGSGDCDDKSVLLAGLLSHEGFQVALLSFGPEGHMATGIGSSTYLYKDTGYSFVETTNISYIGEPTTKLTGGQLLVSEPVVIPIGNGTKVYSSGEETQYIVNAGEVAERKADEMEPQINASVQDLEAKHARITGLESQMASLEGTGNIAGYNADVSTHNALVADYNAELAASRQQMAMYQAYAELHNFIILHAFDRKGTFSYVKANFSG